MQFIVTSTFRLGFPLKRYTSYWLRKESLHDFVVCIYFEKYTIRVKLQTVGSTTEVCVCN